jgi:hypothetical protein
MSLFLKNNLKLNFFMNKKIILILTLLLITLLSCKEVKEMNNSNIDFYLQYSKSTDPGKYKYLYKDLPDSISEICEIINHTIIHPVKVDQFTGLKNTKREDDKFQDIEDILAELVKRNSGGLTMNRKPEERIILACGHFARMLASIMKYKGIPARVRVGFASYLSPAGENKHVDHWICEIWNQKENRWMLVDPDIQMIDFERNKFELANDTWINARCNKINPEKYGYYEWWGLGYIKGNLCHDFFACLNEELIYWEGPEIFFKDIDKLDKNELELLDSIAELLISSEKNIDKLLKLKNERKELQFMN